MVDASEGVLGLEWIDGHSVRRLLPDGSDEGTTEEDGADDDRKMQSSAEDLLNDYKISVGMSIAPSLFECSECSLLDDLMTLIGNEIAKMHRADVIHGDLTTSNMMLRRPAPNHQADLVSLPFATSQHYF